METKKNTLFRFDFNKALLMFALIPMITSLIVALIITISSSSSQVKRLTENSMVALSNETGASYDYYIEQGEELLKEFAKSDVVKNYLLHKDNSELQAEAQKYTENYFNELKDWEGIYVGEWGTTICLTHNAQPVVGKQFRTDEAKQKELMDAMLASDGLFNTGIIFSPASGEVCVSMYAPVYDDNGNPIGYVGGGQYVKAIIERFNKVSDLNLESAYTYLVSPDGTMLYHKDETKIGNPVENAAVKSIVADLKDGKKLTNGFISYEYKGEQKYAAYFIGEDNRYISIITCDEKDVLSEINAITNIAILTGVICVLVFIGVALYFAKVVVRPLKKVTDAITRTSEGDLNAETEIKSVLHETQLLIGAARRLQEVLQKTIGETKEIVSGIKDGSDQIATLSDSSASKAESISIAMEDLSNGAVSMADNVQTINAQVSEIGDAIDRITEGTNKLVESSNLISEATDEASQYMENVSISSENSVESVNNITSQIKDTNKSIENIKDAVDMILSIASQTNLLALNASIEAARAGEAGRGFAVVASEISKLAEQSNSSAGEIKIIVDDIINKSTESVILSEKVSGIILSEQKYISDTQDKFEVLKSSIITSLEQINEVSNIAGLLNSSKDTITASVSDLSAISEENAASNEEVTASITDISTSVSEIATTSQDAVNMVEKLNDTVAYFS